MPTISPVTSTNTNTNYYPPRSPSQSIVRLAGQSTGQASSSGRGFSIWRALGNFARGLVSPITSMFSSPTNFLLGAAMIIGGAALIIATGGAAAPILIGVGLGFAAVQAGTGVYRLATAQNAEQAEAAFGDFGAAVGTAGLSVLGARGSLGPVGISAQGMGRLSATVQSVRAIPTAFRLSATAFRSGAWRTNFSNFGSSAATTYSNVMGSFRDGSWRANTRNYFANLFTRRSQGQTQAPSSNGQAVDLPDSVLGTSYRRAQERLGLRVIVDESLPQNVRSQTVTNSSNGARSTTIRVNRRTAEALRDPAHPQHSRAVRAIHEELTHTHQTPINPVRADGTQMSFREFAARRSLQEMVARSAASSRNGGPRFTSVVRQMNELIRQGKYNEAIALARRNGLNLSDVRGYLGDYRGGVQSGGRVLTQRSNSTATIEELMQTAETLDDVQFAREFAISEGIAPEQFTTHAQAGIRSRISVEEFYDFGRVRQISSLAKEVGISPQQLTQLMRERFTALAHRNGGRLSSDQLAHAERFGLRSEIETLCTEIRRTGTTTVDTEGAVTQPRTFNSRQEAAAYLQETYGYVIESTGRTNTHGRPVYAVRDGRGGRIIDHVSYDIGTGNGDGAHLLGGVWKRCELDGDTFIRTATLDANLSWLAD